MTMTDDAPCCPPDLSWPSAIRSGCFLEDSIHCRVRYSTSAGQGGNLIRACLLCSLTCANFHVCPADQSPSVLWHTRSVNQSNTNIDNRAEPISSVLKGLWWSKMKESIISVVSSSAAVIWPFLFTLCIVNLSVITGFISDKILSNSQIIFQSWEKLRESPIIELCDR